jgi:hypothetical protein
MQGSLVERSCCRSLADDAPVTVFLSRFTRVDVRVSVVPFALDDRLRGRAFYFRSQCDFGSICLS